MTDTPARRVAAELGRRGLALPARLLVEAHLPLAPLLADAGAAFGPLLGRVGGGTVDDLRLLIDDEDGMRRLVDALDDIEEPDARPR